MRQLIVHRRHDLIQGFTQSDVQAGFTQVFRDLQADKAAADDSRGLPCHGKLFELIGVRHRPERADHRMVDARNARAQRGRAGGQNEHVIGFVIGLAGLGFAERLGNPPENAENPRRCQGFRAACGFSELLRNRDKSVGPSQFNYIAKNISSITLGVSSFFAGKIRYVIVIS